MKENSAKDNKGGKISVLLVDDEDRFRKSLARQLHNRNFDVMDTKNGEDAIKIVRHKNPEIVILDQKMPDMDGIQTLKELKRIRPEVQIIMYTGHGCTESARITGKHGVFYYLEKPCDLDELVRVIYSAFEDRKHALALHEIPDTHKNSLKDWLIGVQNSRPGVIILGIILFTAIVMMPTPGMLNTFLTAEKTGKLGEVVSGYSEYHGMVKGQTIAEYYTEKADLYKKVRNVDGQIIKVPLGIEKVAFRAKVMIGILVVAALFWATGAIPVGITALLVGVLMYFFGVFSPKYVAKAYAKDSVVFIMGVLAAAAAISKTGLDRRIGIILLGTSTTLRRFAFIFAPLLAVTAGFFSEHALVAFIAPVLMFVYMGVIKSAGIKKDKNLIVMFLLMLTFCANIGGPGSPAAGGRNAVMLGILSDYNLEVSFVQWVKMGLPFVPVMALVIACYFILIFEKRIKLESVDISAEVRREAEKIGRMTADEYKAAGVLILLIILWITLSGKVGMGGPVILALVLLNFLGIIRWRDINEIRWDIVALYAAASAMGYGLACTGAALWLANGFVALLPEFMKAGTGLCISTSFITGILTNFMSDGATVAAVGPIAVPMATLSGTSPVMVGLATAFASSFAHMLIIGTPNNAIVYSIGKDPETGEQLVTMKDFFIHGFAVFILSMAVIYRTKFCALPFERTFRAFRIPYRLMGSQGFFKRMEILDINSYLNAALFPNDDLSFARIVNTPRRGVGPSMMKKIGDTRTEGVSLQDATRRMVRERVMTKKIHENLSLLFEILDSIKTLPPSRAIERVAEETGYYEYLKKITKIEAEFISRKENIEQLIHTAGSQNDILGYLEEAALIKEEGEEEKSSGITLLTIHSAKGLEFKTVFIVGCEEGLFPHWRSIDAGRKAVSEERRLMYVAMTRAEKFLYLTHSGYRKGERAIRSRFIDQIEESIS